VVVVLAARPSSQTYTLGFFPCQRLFRALTDEVALDFSRKAESERQHFALYVVAETVAILDCPDTTFPRHADVENLHDHKQTSAQSRQFAADDDIVFFHTFQQPAQPTLVVVLRPAYRLLNPVVNRQILLLAKIHDLKALILHRLLVAAYPDISVHNLPKIFCKYNKKYRIILQKDKVYIKWSNEIFLFLLPNVKSVIGNIFDFLRLYKNLYGLSNFFSSFLKIVSRFSFSPSRPYGFLCLFYNHDDFTFFFLFYYFYLRSLAFHTKSSRTILMM